MTTRTRPALPTAPADDRGSGGRRLRRFGTLARAETTILLRNKTAAFTAIGIPFMMGLLFAGIGLDDPALLGVALTTGLVAMGILFVTYYSMVTSLVGRREQLVLKRLYAGEPTPMEVLLAPAVPLWVLFVIQSTIGIVVAGLLFGTPVAHPWALPLAVLGGTSAWTGLAIWSATWTKTVESAQLTTVPLMLIALGLSGLMVPLQLLPAPVQFVAHLLPMTPVLDLINLAYLGIGTDGNPLTGAPDLLLATAGMVLPLVAWTAFGLWVALRNFRWDARS